MTLEIQETVGDSDFPMPIDSDEISLNLEAPLTIETLGIEIEEEAPFTKQDFEDALKRVSRPKKQAPHAEGKSET